MLFKRALDDPLYTQPLLATGIQAGGGTRDIVYVPTVNNSVYAFDANDPQAALPLWHVNFGTPADGNGGWDGVSNFSESFLKLSPQLRLLDWFTPTNHFALDKEDADQNPSGATLIPGTHLVLGGGKEGVLYTLDLRNLGHLGDDHVLQHFRATASHLRSLVYWNSAKNGNLLFVWGQRDKAKVYKLEGSTIAETPLTTRDIPNEGHPGAMLSLSANGGKDSILWAGIHATGDSWHESRPGVLYVYDAEDIDYELRNPGRCQDGTTVADTPRWLRPRSQMGRVYLASFGSEKIGTGQFCVYGLLPSAGAALLATPSAVTAAVAAKRLTLTWAPVQGALLYRVLRKSTLDPKAKTVAMGLTIPSYTEPAPERGESMSYSVVAVAADGRVSSVSGSATIASPKRKEMEE